MTDTIPVAEVPANEVQWVARLRKARGQMLGELHKIIVGQEEVLEQLIYAVLCRGHCLLEGVPGLAKTVMVQTLGATLNLSFRRIQFTPDLMPSDITGTDIIQEDAQTGRRQLEFIPGPVFTNLLLADEINRTPPKTQAALLEAMQERRTTCRGRTYDCPTHSLCLRPRIQLSRKAPTLCLRRNWTGSCSWSRSVTRPAPTRSRS